MDRKSNILSIIFSVLFVITLIFGVTYAAYTWQSSNDFIEGESSCFNVIYEKGNDIGNNNNLEKLYLGSSYKDGISTTVKIAIDSKCNDISGIGTLYLNTKNETSDIYIENELLNYYVLVDNSKVSSGVINTRDSIEIYKDFELTYDVKTITVYVWLDGSKVNNDNLETVLNGTYRGNITADVENR